MHSQSRFSIIAMWCTIGATQCFRRHESWCTFCFVLLYLLQSFVLFKVRILRFKGSGFGVHRFIPFWLTGRMCMVTVVTSRFGLSKVYLVRQQTFCGGICFLYSWLGVISTFVNMENTSLRRVRGLVYRGNLDFCKLSTTCMELHIVVTVCAMASLIVIAKAACC